MQKLIIGAIIVLVVIGGGLWFVNRANGPEEVLNQDKSAVSPSETQSENSESELDNGGDIVIEESDEIKKFTVIGSSDFRFSLSEIRVKKGDTVRITFKNESGFHDWRLDEFDAVTKQIEAGKEETIEFVADKAGIFEYYCSVGKHRELGMKGSFIVEE